MYATSWLCLIPGLLPWASAGPFLPSASPTPVNHVAGLVRAEPTSSYAPTFTDPVKSYTHDIQRAIASFLSNEVIVSQDPVSSSTAPALIPSPTTTADTAAETLDPAGEDKIIGTTDDSTNSSDGGIIDLDPIAYDPPCQQIKTGPTKPMITGENV